MAKTLSVLSKGSTKAMIIALALSELPEKRSTQIFSSDKITVAFAGTNLLPLNDDNQWRCGKDREIDRLVGSEFNVWMVIVEMEERREGRIDLTYL